MAENAKAYTQARAWEAHKVLRLAPQHRQVQAPLEAPRLICVHHEVLQRKRPQASVRYAWLQRGIGRGHGCHGCEVQPAQGPTPLPRSRIGNTLPISGCGASTPPRPQTRKIPRSTLTRARPFGVAYLEMPRSTEATTAEEGPGWYATGAMSTTTRRSTSGASAVSAKDMANFPPYRHGGEGSQA